MKQSKQQGFAMIVVVIAGVLLVGGAVVTTFIMRSNKDSSSQATQTKPTKSDTKVAAMPDSQTPAPVEKTCTRDLTMYVSVTEGHSLRASASLDSARVTTAPYRAAVKVGCKDGEWYSAEYNGQVGYVYAQYLSATQPAVSTQQTSPASGSMTQDKCSNVTSLYTVKDPTSIYVLVDGKAVSGNQSVSKGTYIKGGKCAMWQSREVSGYWEYEATLYRFSDLSTSKP